MLAVVLPLAVSVWYLFTRAADQYHSTTAFSVRSEELGGAAAGLLGALTQVGGGSASDTDILFDYIRSQEMVAAVDSGSTSGRSTTAPRRATSSSPSATTPRSRR